MTGGASGGAFARLIATDKDPARGVRRVAPRDRLLLVRVEKST